ncbi:MAG: arginine--tRNA ligase [Candidatus Moranbacteria bacterium RIFCSPLOWO2_02_FULL_48_19]|nr:MAG: arginine--tRNA ligase [Candidatus Moranbacteria bacterium RIFCSPLOWO2_02_FULL_48_19]OGI30874.1 MAG: arginine--tRNA ligase [Candidatus Moranbacteria bacterium RIFCSPLOWO2_12_FULL_48_12]
MILEQQIRSVLGEMQKAGTLPVFEVPEIRVERPKEEQFGEYSSNVALMFAKQAGKSPMELAETIRQQLLYLCHSESSEAESRNLEIPRQARDDNEKLFEKIEVVKPGYINFYLSQKALGAVVREVLAKKERYGESEIGNGIKVNNEFISANPTGPLHLGNGRGGFYADVLSRVLRKAGFEVTNEYYINDAGEQILKLGHSVLKDSEAVYSGEYIDELNKRLTTDDLKQKVKEVGEKAAGIVMEEMIKKTLQEKMQVSFDVFTSEKKDIEENGYINKALEILRAKENLVYENEGALWLKTTLYGDDKDRVLLKQDGAKTYLASDCGYILYKMERSFERIIEVWGADHHGYVARFRAAAQALGFTGKVDFILVQLVKLVKDGEEVRMSKRAGNVITIDKLIEKVGHDVARFFFLLYAPETQMNFDLGLAEERSQKNPVFYVQYAHARLSSILRKAEEEGLAKTSGDLNLLVHPKERELICELLFFPELMETIARDFTVHRLPQYAIRLADKLHSFYADCRVLNGENKELSLARLELIKAVKVVLAETLDVMGIAAPEKM